ncbi:MAG: hypothetical protein WCX32_01085 [Clostridia bacterium]|jgi:hypothetical protein|nr:hypothetical protein [Clostridia bacterium]
MKKLPKILLAGVMLASSLAFIGCEGEDIAGYISFNSAQEVYAFSALSSAELLDADLLTNTTLPLSYAPSLSMAGSGFNLAVEDQMDEINKYLNVMEQYLGDDSALTVESQVSNRVEYTVKLVYTTRDILGNSLVYTLYYNEEVTAEIDETDAVHQDDISDETVQAQYEVMLNGLIVVGENEYALEGLIRNEGDEQEIIMFSKIDKDNYVKVKYEIDSLEKKFMYEVVANGTIQTKTQIKLEQEEDGVKIRLQFIEGGNKGEYTFKKEIEDGETIIKIKYKVADETSLIEKGNIKVKVIINEETGENTYEYYVKAENKEGELTMNQERHQHRNQEQNEEHNND